MKPDFSGYVTKANLKCADGRTIMPGAFAHQDGMKVPLVYQHNHQDVMQVLGHAILSKKEDGMWGDMYLNQGATGVHAKQLVQNKDLDKMSIWAKDLEEQGYLVHDGMIQEVSLVLSGSNPGARVTNVLMHSDLDEIENMFVVTGDIIMHSDIVHADDEKKVEETKTEEQTIGDVIDTLTEDELTKVIEETVTEAITQALAEEPELTHDNMDSSKKGTSMSRNLFQNQEGGTATIAKKGELKHDDVANILAHAQGVSPTQLGTSFNDGIATGSLRELVRSEQGRELMHAETYGIQNMETLFPDAQDLMNRPTWVDRRQEWVKVFLNGTSHSPFAKVRTMHADITADEARARGYIKGNEKEEEVFPVFKRETDAAWVIKMQKLDREDIIKITSFDVVAWMKAEMRGKLDEEIARAAMFGDGRPEMVGGVMNKDKIKDPGKYNNSGSGIRAIVNDNNLYVTTYDVPLAANATGAALNALLDKRVETGEDYLGSGNLTAFVSYKLASQLLTIRDEFQHRIYRNLSEVAGDMDVAQIVKVPTALFQTDVLMVVLDLRDYNFGTDRGGEITLFDDFDIKFNQYLYLIETFLSGALVLPYSAQVFRRVDPTDTLVVPNKPTVVDNVITIPTQAGVQYRRLDTGALAAAGSTITLDDTDLIYVDIQAETASDSYTFGDNSAMRTRWNFRFKPA